MCACVLSCFSHVWLFVTLRTIAQQAPLSTGFSRQEYWGGLLFPPPGDLPNPGIEPAPLIPPALAGRFFTTGAIFTINILNYFSGRLPISTSFSCFSGVLSFSFTWQITLSACSFWLSFGDCGFLSGGCGIVVLLASSVCPLVDEAKRPV